MLIKAGTLYDVEIKGLIAEMWSALEEHENLETDCDWLNSWEYEFVMDLGKKLKLMPAIQLSRKQGDKIEEVYLKFQNS